jgi:hypothetical protein
MVRPADNCLPFTFTRPVADIRVGILTIREKWERVLGSTTSTVTEDYLSNKWPLVEMEENIMINASFLPTPELVAQIESLEQDQAIFQRGRSCGVFTLEDQEVDFEVYSTGIRGRAIQNSKYLGYFFKEQGGYNCRF